MVAPPEVPDPASARAPDDGPAPQTDIENRRNHYRLLHVQPDAPVAVIKASYRALMGALRLHPDLGGDHAQASLVNQAWELLSDPDRRAAYDQALQARQPPPRQMSAAQAGLAKASDAMAMSARPACALCSLAAPLQPRPNSRCTRCQAPLAAMPQPGSQAHELWGRRGAVRRDQSHVAMLQVGWPAPPLPVRWRDLSLSGLSFFAPRPLVPGQRLHLGDSLLETVAEVVGCRAQGRLFVVHARLLTLLLLMPTGVFVSARA